MNREDNLKEKFKQALISTAKVISDDIFVEKKNEKNIYKPIDHNFSLNNYIIRGTIICQF